MGAILTFAQQKGGAGKTTLLIHLAAHWAAEGRRIAFADLDPQGTLSRWHSLADAPMTLIETRDYRAGADIKAAARDHDLVLVDCPGSASSLLEAALRESDLVVSPCQPSPMDIWAAESIAAMAAKARAPLIAVLNRVPARGAAGDEAAAALAELGIEVAAARLGNRIAYAREISAGRTALSSARAGPAAGEVGELAAEIATQAGAA